MRSFIEAFIWLFKLISKAFEAIMLFYADF